jgi:diguanylate cyclase (GGDEF)-like protein
MQAAWHGIIVLMSELAPDMKILVLSSRPERTRRWADELHDLPAEIWLRRQDVPENVQLDIILTDLILAEITAFVDSDIGILHIGGAETFASQPTSISLPADATARELQLACRLLGEIVRLRRQQRAGAELHRRLAEEAMSDPLTGLPNRRAWDRALDERLNELSPREATANRGLCVAILDLDFFKQVNDAHGHAIGDEVLRTTGSAIRACLRQDDFVARLGGDEFGLLLWVRDQPAAQATIDRVRQALPNRLTESGLTAVNASAGYCIVLPIDSSAQYASASTQLIPNADSLYSSADAALRSAKQQGRNRTVGWHARNEAMGVE